MAGRSTHPQTPAASTWRRLVNEALNSRQLPLKNGRAAATKLEGALGEGALTTKIKSKMALDDYVKARTINVDTQGSVVTLTGIVGSSAERDRAVRLAKETESHKSCRQARGEERQRVQVGPEQRVRAVPVHAGRRGLDEQAPRRSLEKLR